MMIKFLFLSSCFCLVLIGALWFSSLRLFYMQINRKWRREKLESWRKGLIRWSFDIHPVIMPSLVFHYWIIQCKIVVAGWCWITREKRKKSCESCFTRSQLLMTLFPYNSLTEWSLSLSLSRSFCPSPLIAMWTLFRCKIMRNDNNSNNLQIYQYHGSRRGGKQNGTKVNRLSDWNFK